MAPMPKVTPKCGPKGGRPSKFAEPSRPITVTLPDRILNRLVEVDADRALAIVKAVEAVLGEAPTRTEMVRELRFDKDETLLTVADNRLLRSISWLTMIEIAPGHHLLSLQKGISIEKLEVTLCDLLDAHPEASISERRTLERLVECIRTPRRNRALRTEEILVIRNGSPLSATVSHKGLRLPADERPPSQTFDA